MNATRFILIALTAFALPCANVFADNCTDKYENIKTDEICRYFNSNNVNARCCISPAELNALSKKNAQIIKV
ncbi:MAG: hypothetical protein LBB23_02645 [Rickettsiales bacterium]|jgi:hypothetical protein|nr:hypothetical protein [Rickettsiales bacterium]